MARRSKSPRQPATLVLLAAGTGIALVAAGSSQAVPSRPLVPLPSGQLARCQASALLRPSCIRKVPRVTGNYDAAKGSDRAGPVFHVFNLEHFVPSRPPKGAHITVAAGAVWRLTPYADPDRRSRSVQLTEKVRRASRTRPVSFGHRGWHGRKGILYLAPSYPDGGMLGDHLVFQWGRGNHLRVVSLHAWAPLEETAATLRAMVETLP